MAGNSTTYTGNGATRAAQDKVCGYEYTVKRGDSFYLIANRLGVPLRDLLAANAEINPARLMVGDVLCIPMEEDDAPPETQVPAQPETPVLPTPEVSPELPPEEDLDSPATDEDQPAEPGEGPVVDESAVCPEANRYTVTANQTAADIQIRTGLSRHTLQSANPSVNLDALQAGQVLCVPEENIPCPAQMTYVMRQGDSLESVALALDVSIGAILRANPCLAPGDFGAGVCVVVPG